MTRLADSNAGCTLTNTVTPGITALEYHHRRAALARKLPPNSIALLVASEVKYRSGPVFYPFHQEPNFYYLTGERPRGGSRARDIR